MPEMLYNVEGRVKADMKRIFTSGYRMLNCLARAIPLMPGILISVSKRSIGVFFEAISRASSPFEAKIGRYSYADNISLRRLRIAGSLSTTSTVGLFFLCVMSSYNQQTNFRQLKPNGDLLISEPAKEVNA